MDFPKRWISQTELLFAGLNFSWTWPISRWGSRLYRAAASMSSSRVGVFRITIERSIKLDFAVLIADSSSASSEVCTTSLAGEFSSSSSESLSIPTFQVSLTRVPVTIEKTRMKDSLRSSSIFNTLCQISIASWSRKSSELFRWLSWRAAMLVAQALNPRLVSCIVLSTASRSIELFVA
jgi:hypothetical protein